MVSRFLTAWTAALVFLQAGATQLPIDDAYKPFIVLGIGAIAVFFTTLTKGEQPASAKHRDGGKFY